MDRKKEKLCSPFLLPPPPWPPPAGGAGLEKVKREKIAWTPSPARHRPKRKNYEDSIWKDQK